MLHLMCTTEVKKTYTVENTEAITFSDLQILRNIAGTGSNVMAFDTTTNAPQQFYRVLTQ